VQGNLKPVVCHNCWGASTADVNESKDFTSFTLLALLPPEVQFLANFGNSYSNVPSS
jgi:hypothetical protein